MRASANGDVEPRNRWAVPLLDARLGGPAERFAVATARPPSGRGVLRRDPRGPRRPHRDRDRARAPRDRRAAPHGRPGADRRELRRHDGRRAHAVPDGRLRGRARRWAALRSCRSWSGRSRSSAPCCASGGSRPSRVFALAVESATYRVTSLARPARAAGRHAARRPPGQRLLPVRPHRGVRRRLRRARPARHVTVPQPRRATPRVGRRDPGPGLRRLRPDVPRHAPPARRRRRRP